MSKPEAWPGVFAEAVGPAGPVARRLRSGGAAAGPVARRLHWHRAAGPALRMARAHRTVTMKLKDISMRMCSTNPRWSRGLLVLTAVQRDRVVQLR